MYLKHILFIVFFVVCIKIFIYMVPLVVVVFNCDVSRFGSVYNWYDYGFYVYIFESFCDVYDALCDFFVC